MNTSRTSSWYLRFIPKEILAAAVVGAFAAGGIWYNLNAQAEETEQKVTRALAQNDQLKASLEALKTKSEVQTEQLKHISENLNELKVTAQKRSEVIDEKLDNLTGLIIERTQ